MSNRCRVGLAAAVMIWSGGAFADFHKSGKLPDGTYACTLFSGGMDMLMGNFEIVGNTYKGPAYDGKYEGTYTYELTPEGVILWHGPLGGFTSDGHSVVSSVLYSHDPKKAGFSIMVKTPRGTFHKLDCDIQPS